MSLIYTKYILGIDDGIFRSFNSVFKSIVLTLFSCHVWRISRALLFLFSKIFESPTAHGEKVYLRVILILYTNPLTYHGAMLMPSQGSISFLILSRNLNTLRTGEIARLSKREKGKLLTFRPPSHRHSVKARSSRI